MVFDFVWRSASAVDALETFSLLAICSIRLDVKIKIDQQYLNLSQNLPSCSCTFNAARDSSSNDDSIAKLPLMSKSLSSCCCWLTQKFNFAFLNTVSAALRVYSVSVIDFSGCEALYSILKSYKCALDRNLM